MFTVSQYQQFQSRVLIPDSSLKKYMQLLPVISARLRPSSDIFLPCQTKLQFESTVARQKDLIDSDVLPEVTKFKIYWLKPLSNSLCNSQQQKHSMWIVTRPESCSTAELVELNCLLNLIQKSDSYAVLLPCFCGMFFLNLTRHGKSRTSEQDRKHC